MSSAVISMAWRNVWRHTWRSAIAMAVIAIGLAALLFLWGLSDGLHNTMIRNFQSLLTGTLQIHQQGYFKQPQLSKHLAKPRQVIEIMERLGVRQWLPRLQQFVLATGVQASTGILLVGVDPERERRWIRLASMVRTGRFLAVGDGSVCVLGSMSARQLRVSIGDTVALRTWGADGRRATGRCRVVGIMSGVGYDLDRGAMFAPLAAVQEMLRMPQQLTHMVTVLPAAQLEQVAPALSRRLADMDVEVLRWDQMFPVIQEWVRLDDRFFYVVLSVVLVIVSIGGLNTMLMSTLERQREFALLSALGTRGAILGAIVGVEALIIGGVGTGLGTFMGLGSVVLFGYVGVDLGFMSDLLTRLYIDPVLYPQINTKHLLVSCLSMLGATLVAALYPVWKVMRIQPAEGLRSV